MEFNTCLYQSNKITVFENSQRNASHNFVNILFPCHSHIFAAHHNLWKMKLNYSNDVNDEKMDERHFVIEIMRCSIVYSKNLFHLKANFYIPISLIIILIHPTPLADLNIMGDVSSIIDLPYIRLTNTR